MRPCERGLHRQTDAARNTSIAAGWPGASVLIQRR